MHKTNKYEKKILNCKLALQSKKNKINDNGAILTATVA